MGDCIFCKIINREIPSDIVYEDDLVIAFRDIQPVAPVHVLVVPKDHIPSCNEVEPQQEQVIGHVFTVCKKIADQLGVAADGYRIINNCGEDAGQTVKHIHFHLIAGVKMGEKLL